MTQCFPLICCSRIARRATVFASLVSGRYESTLGIETAVCFGMVGNRVSAFCWSTFPTVISESALIKRRLPSSHTNGVSTITITISREAAGRPIELLLFTSRCCLFDYSLIFYIIKIEIYKYRYPQNANVTVDLIKFFLYIKKKTRENPSNLISTNCKTDCICNFFNIASVIYS